MAVASFIGLVGANPAATVLDNLTTGAPVYRQGEFPHDTHPGQYTGSAQYWSLQRPLTTPAFAA